MFYRIDLAPGVHQNPEGAGLPVQGRDPQEQSKLEALPCAPYLSGQVRFAGSREGYLLVGASLPFTSGSAPPLPLGFMYIRVGQNFGARTP